MASKRSVLRTEATGENIGAGITPIDPGALSGPLVGASFVAGVAAALALCDAPYPRPGSEPTDVRRYFGGTPAPPRLT